MDSGYDAEVRGRMTMPLPPIAPVPGPIEPPMPAFIRYAPWARAIIALPHRYIGNDDPVLKKN